MWFSRTCGQPMHRASTGRTRSARVPRLALQLPRRPPRPRGHMNRLDACQPLRRGWPALPRVSDKDAALRGALGPAPPAPPTPARPLQ